MGNPSVVVFENPETPEKQIELTNGGFETTVMADEEKIELLVELLNGCPDHRSYRALRKPKANCEKCRSLYEVRQKLKAAQVL